MRIRGQGAPSSNLQKIDETAGTKHNTAQRERIFTGAPSTASNRREDEIFTGAPSTTSNEKQDTWTLGYGCQRLPEYNKIDLEGL